MDAIDYFFIGAVAISLLYFVIFLDKKCHIELAEDLRLRSITIITNAQEQVNRVETKTITELGRVDMKDGWQNMDLENQSEINRHKADKEAEKNAKTSEEIAKLMRGCKVKRYSPTGELLEEPKS